MNTRGPTALVVLGVGRELGLLDGSLYSLLYFLLYSVMAVMAVLALVAAAMTGPPPSLVDAMSVSGSGPDV